MANPIMPADLADIIAAHKALFGGFVMQADPETTPPADPQPEQADEPETDDLGDAGKRALAAERRAKKAAERHAAELQAQLDKIAEADKTETQKALDRATKAEKDRDDLAAQLDALRREQAVYRLAGNADPAALLDSRTFTAALADLELDDDKAITAAIKEAVKTNPLLSRSRSGGDLHEGQRQQANQTNTAPGVHRMAAAFDAHMGTA